MHQIIPFSVPTIEDEEINEVVATLRSGWLTTGPRTAQFEAEFKAYVGSSYALAVNSATAGLHLALAGLGIGRGDEVITTPLTFCATVNTIMHVGATPVLADVGPDGNIDPTSIAERITRRTRAILPVHLGGLPCEMDSIWELARRHGLFVVEDAAHAVEATRLELETP
jgi:dTDP-4-amino-4,6-dideoxygalactose transaminase